MLMRSKLFVPASRPELFAKAANSAADALSFDLEDAVAMDRKAEARALLAAFLRDPPPGIRKIIVVRVNAVGTELFKDDLAAVASPVLDAVNLPMVEDAAEVIDAAAELDKLEAGSTRSRPIGLLANIE